MKRSQRGWINWALIFWAGMRNALWAAGVIGVFVCFVFGAWLLIEAVREAA